MTVDGGRARSVRAGAVLAVAVMLAAVVPVVTADAQQGHPLRASVAGQADPDPNVEFRGRGWGHSVGMSQFGAYAMAREGRSAATILAHYYPSTQLGTVDEAQRVTVALQTPRQRGQSVEALTRPVRWRLCPSGGGSCGTIEQPVGQTWRLVTFPDRPDRIQLRDAADRAVYASSGSVWAGLSDRDTFQDTTRQLRFVDTGNRYAYGRMIFSASASELRISNQLPMEGYLRGIAEVPSGWGGASGGQEALAAQVIIARSFVIGRGRTTCATPACQVFRGYNKELEASGGNWVRAVRDTSGTVVRDARGAIANTFYSSSHGGRTEASEDSWAFGGTVDYLRSVDDPWSLDGRNPMRRWTAVVRNRDLRRVTGTPFVITRVEVRSRTSGGSPSVLRLHGRDGQMRDFTTTPDAQQTRNCNRRHAANSLRCDLPATITNAAGQPFSAAGGRLPSSQVRGSGFAPFTDDDGSIHEYAIVFAQAAGIADGTSATTYAPRRAVTRGQMARFLFQTFDLPERRDHNFSDVSSTNTHVTAIASVAAAGIADGYDDGTFRPDQAVTRQQMATFLTNAMGLTPRDPSFSDVGGTHARNVGAIAHAGITDGCGGDRFCPNDPVTRGQMATFLYRSVRSLR